MAVYCIALALFLVPSLTIRNSRITVALFGLVAWFLAAFRDLFMGLYDSTGTYYQLFVLVQAHGFGELTSGSVGLESAAFAFITKVIQIFTGDNYQAYIAVLSALYISCACSAILRFSEDRQWSGGQTTLACIIYFALTFFYSFTMLRQFAALSVLLAFAYPEIERRRIVRFLASVSVAGLFHSTALIFLVAYPLCTLLEYRRRQLLIVCAMSVIGIIAPSIVMSALGGIPISALQIRLGYIAHGIYEAETSGVGYGTLIFLSILLLCCIWKTQGKRDDRYSNLLWLVSLGVIFQAWSHIIVEFYRVAMYFIVFNSLLIPCRVQLVSEKKAKMHVLYAVMAVVLCYGLLILANDVGAIPYRFCWDAGAWIS